MAKRRELVMVKGKTGVYHRFQLVGSEKDVRSSKYFFLDKVFTDPAKQQKYEDFLTSLIPVGGGYYGRIAEKAGVPSWEGERAGKSIKGVSMRVPRSKESFLGVLITKLHPEEEHYRTTLLSEKHEGVSDDAVAQEFDKRRKAFDEVRGIDALYADSEYIDDDFNDFTTVSRILGKFEGGDNLEALHRELNTVKGERLKQFEADKVRAKKVKEDDQRAIDQYHKFESNKQKFAQAINKLDLTNIPLKEVYSKLFFSAPSQWFNTYSSRIPVTIEVGGTKREGTYNQILDFFLKHKKDVTGTQKILTFSILHVDPEQIPNPYEDSYNDAIKRFIEKCLEDELDEPTDDIEKAVKSPKLVKKVKLIHRDGKSFFATYYVNPETGEKISNTKVESPELHSHHDEVGIGDEVFYPVKGGLERGRIKRFEFATKKYPAGAMILDLGDGKEKAVSLSVDRPITKTPASAPIRFGETIEKKISITDKYATDISDLVIKDSIASLGGSSDAKLVSLTDGSKFVIKTPRKKHVIPNIEQLRVEVLADKIYKLFGAGAPDSFMTKYNGEEVKAALFMRETQTLGSLSTREKLSAYAKLEKHFVLDCLLGNWDVIGAGEDNILVDSAANVHRIDNGGSMFYRAQGAEKSTSDFSSEVKELRTFLDGTNPSASKAFKGVTDAEKKQQTEQILGKLKEIGSLIDRSDLLMVRKTQLIEIINARAAYLKKEFVDPKPKPVDPYGDYDKTKYPSKATAEFFESKSWKDLQVEGNAGIKEHVAEKMLEIERMHDKEGTYKKFADRKGISVEEWKKRAQAHVEKLVGDSNFFRATDVYYLDKILLTDKRYKSQFEVGRSDGSMSPGYRSRTEHEYFGFKDSVSADKEKRPIYGYYSNDGNGVINGAGTAPPPNCVGGYGRVTVKMKKSVAMKKATITYSDSLGDEGQVAATFAAKPHFTSWGYADPLEWTDTKRRGSYTEAQYHNQFTTDDIESIHFSLKNFHSEADGLTQMNKMVDIARHTGIPIKFY